MTKVRQNKEIPRVVIDTNVWISGLVFGGAPGTVLQLFVGGDIIVVISEELLSELRRKIIQKFPLFIPKLGLLEASIREDATMVALGSVTIKESRDADDNKVLETAVIGGCRHVISGDKDLLAVESYQDIQIVAPMEFLNILKYEKRATLHL